MNKLSLPNDALLGEVAAALREGREAVIIPTGNSMQPFIRGGRDRVVLRRQPEPAVGDIVLARIGGRYILHRLVAREGEAITLMGDGNIRGRERCSKEDVIGTVAEIIRPDGKRIRPGKGTAWRVLLPVRRYLLAIYRRLI